MIGNHVICAMHSSGSGNVLPLYQKELKNYQDIQKYINSNFDTYNSLTPNWYYKVLR